MSEIDDSVLANSEVASFEKDSPRTVHTAEPQFLISEWMKDAAREIAAIHTCYFPTVTAIIARHAAQAPAQTAVTESLTYKIVGENKYLLKRDGSGWIGPTDATDCEMQLWATLESAAALIAKLAEGLRQAHAQLGHMCVPNSKGSLHRATTEDTGWFVDWSREAEALLSLPGVPKEEKNG